MNTSDSATVFMPVTNVPDLIAESGLAGTTTEVIRPSCNMNGSALDSNGMFTITATFGAASLDSFKWKTFGPNNTTTCVDSSMTPIIPAGSATSHLFKVAGSGSNIPAGLYTTQIYGFAGTCSGSTMVTTNVLPGSDEPVVACNNNINVSVDGQCMADITIGMVLAGSSSPCAMAVMDSLVLKHSNGVVIPTVNVGSGNADTIRVPDASDYIGKSLIIEVHSSNTSASNSCWGNLIFEDKLAPVLTCDTLMTDFTLILNSL